MSNEQLVAKVWNYAHVLRDQGISYGDYVQQITFLLFLKMDQERVELLGEGSSIPEKWCWPTLAGKDGDALELHYRHTLEALAKADGLIDKEGPWIGYNVDVKGEIYEGLLERNASEVKSGAGQYSTPRPVIDAIVRCVDPRIGETVCDPGGFLRSAYDHMKGQSQDREKLRHGSLRGFDIVDEIVRLPKKNRKSKPPYNWQLYKKRYLIENMFAKLKDWRQVATRYDRCAHTFMSAIHIAASVIFYLKE